MARTPKYRIVEGLRMPAGFPPQALREALEFEPRAGDVVVATYPKCGTTWMQYIIWLLCHGGRPLPPEGRIGEVFPHIEEVGRAGVEALAAPRLIKTHLTARQFAVAPAARYVVVARNPFDCAVSFYYHTRGFPQHYDFAEGEFDEFFECFVRGEVDFGDYFDHLTSWCAYAEDSNVMLVTYEALKADTPGRIAALGEFIGGAAAETVRDRGKLEAVVAESAFSRMQTHQQRWSSARPPELPFVRGGRVGDWRAHFSAAQTRRLLERFEARTHGTIAADLWPDELARAREAAGHS